MSDDNRVDLGEISDNQFWAMADAVPAGAELIRHPADGGPSIKYVKAEDGLWYSENSETGLHPMDFSFGYLENEDD